MCIRDRVHSYHLATILGCQHIIMLGSDVNALVPVSYTHLSRLAHFDSFQVKKHVVVFLLEGKHTFHTVSYTHLEAVAAMT